jgi:hypothetical protein
MTAVHRGSALRSLAVSLAGVRSGRADTFLTIEIGAHTFDYKMGAVEIDGTGETHYGAAGLKTAHEAVACSWRSDNPDGFHKRLWGCLDLAVAEARRHSEANQGPCDPWRSQEGELMSAAKWWKRRNFDG